MFGLTMHVEETDDNPFWGKTEFDAVYPPTHWKVTLSSDNGAAPMTIIYSMGNAYKGKEPTLYQVLECLHAETLPDPLMTFEDWADTYGWDSDSRKAEAIFKKCRQNSEHLFALMGAETHSLFMAMLWE